MPTEYRVHRRLTELGRIYGAGAKVPLTQEDLARMTGASRQTVNRVLRKAEADGALELMRGAFAILDATRLGT